MRKDKRMKRLEMNQGDRSARRRDQRGALRTANATKEKLNARETVDRERMAGKTRKVGESEQVNADRSVRDVARGERRAEKKNGGFGERQRRQVV